MESWDLLELKGHVERVYGAEQSLLASRPLDSIFENQEFSRYHYSELKRLISEHADYNRTERDYFRLVWSTISSVRQSEYQFKIACRAHIISLLRHMHSIPDLLAHAVYYIFGFNLMPRTRLDLNKVNLFFVKKLLKDSEVYNVLFDLLDDFTNSEDFQYLKDLGNHTKHRANIIPKHSYSLRHQAEEVYQFFFEAFDKYPEMPVINFLNREYDREGEKIIRIGNEINDIISKRC